MENSGSSDKSIVKEETTQDPEMKTKINEKKKENHHPK
jgi:hypothetical protein